MKRIHALFTLAAAAAAPAAAQIIPKDAAIPVQVLKGTGEFSAKLNGAVMPTGHGWKGVMDKDRRLQLMVPDKWKVETRVEEDTTLHITPPGQGKDAKAVLLVVISAPRDADPLEMEAPIAEEYAAELAKHPDLARQHYQPTDSGFVLERGMKFALAGGTMIGDKEQVYQQEQLLFVGEDRIVSVQFTATKEEFPHYADDLAKIFASYQNMGVKKLDPDAQ